ncbi:MAG: hypothetical protein ACP5MG_03350 [Verrucomicrobiia bacterium]
MQLVLGLIFLIAAFCSKADFSYAIVASKNTSKDKSWNEVIAILKNKYNGTVFIYTNSIDEIIKSLSQFRPTHTAFVARPSEATRDYVIKVNQITRSLDDDPYGYTIWGIVTGYDAQNAKSIVSAKGPLIIRRVAAGTSVPLEYFEEGVWYSEVKAGFGMEKKQGETPREISTPIDTTRLLVGELNGVADMFVTSGHATERDWQIGYSYKNGSFRSEAGLLYGIDTTGRKFEIKSLHPRVYLPVGNCLMGHIDSSNAMALAWMKSAGVVQMLGYTVPTWFGYMGWGVLDYFAEQPGRFTFSEAFFANQQALIWCLQNNPNSKGHLFDRDVVAFYGDPAYEARLKPAPSGWDQNLVFSNDTYTLTIRLLKGEKSFSLLDPNGSQRGGRPIFQFLPERLHKVQLVESDGLNPVITENFVLVPQPSKPYREVYKVVFKKLK